MVAEIKMITSKRYNKTRTIDNMLSPIEISANNLAVFASLGISSPLNLAIAIAFLAIIKAITAGIKLNIQTTKNEASETIPKIIANWALSLTSALEL